MKNLFYFLYKSFTIYSFTSVFHKRIIKTMIQNFLNINIYVIINQ